MSFSPLQPFPIPDLPPDQSGATGSLIWLPVASLGIESDYQRPVLEAGRKTIARIARGFEWAKFSPVIVTRSGRSAYAIIDGQHRATAALIRGHAEVPCYVVAADTPHAARIFAAVNGTVTSMSALALFKAARAGGEEWAAAIDRVCVASGVTPMTHPVPASRMRPYQTNAVGTLRKMVAGLGEPLVTAALKLLVAAKHSEKPGAITSRWIINACSLMMSHPGWVARTDDVARVMAVIDLGLAEPMGIEQALVRRLGDGRSGGETWPAIVARVQDLKSRRLSPSMIAATLRLPYAEVERALREVQS